MIIHIEAIVIVNSGVYFKGEISSFHFKILPLQDDGGITSALISPLLCNQEKEKTGQ